jgi:hypothetical protein
MKHSESDGFETRPTSFASFACFAVRFFFVSFVRFVVKLAFLV